MIIKDQVKPNIIATVLHYPVVSCRAAAFARRIPPDVELKTLLLKIGERTVAAHIRGSHRLVTPSIKKIFRTKNVCFLDHDTLKGFGLAPGTINPWNIGFCCNHLVCLRTQEVEAMATNDSRLDQGILFHTEELLNLRGLIMGYFGNERIN